MALFQITKGEFVGAEIRTTPENPRRVSVIDVIRTITGVSNPHDKLADMRKTYPESLGETIGFSESYKFAGKGNRTAQVFVSQNACSDRYRVQM